MDSSEGIVKSVDGIYKNILDKFNPGAKHVIQSSKSYLKALQNVSTASKNFIESLAKLGVNANDEGTADIGNALLDLVEVFSSIEEKHTNILKAFYVDFILPLENNIEKDTKVIQLEQKKFVQLHKQRVESFNKATSAMKKHRKKKNNAEKELKCIQNLEEEKKLLDNFCEMSIRNAKIQERRRYGFILERCVLSMAKHWSQFFSVGHSSIDSNIEWWNETAKTRELLPTNNEIATLKRPVELKAINSSNFDDYGSVKSYMRKTQSHHGSFLEVDPNENYQATNNSSRHPPPRSMSEHSLVSSHIARKQSAASSNNVIVTAIFDYLSPAENQLGFHEGDKIQVIGEKIQGWQFGENLRSNLYGWFPISYIQTESERKSREQEEDDHRISRKQMDGISHDRESMNKYQKLDNPPMERAPSPPASSAKSSVRHGSSTLNFSKQGQQQQNERNDNKPPANAAIYSSNDSGFSNENLPPVDYSDDDLPKKVPIRDATQDKLHHHHKAKNAGVASDTEDFNDDYSKIASMKQSNSFGNLMESTSSNNRMHHESNFNVDTTTMKRNKSFWRFSKSEDILEGMALWKHRDLVPIEGELVDNKEMFKDLSTLKKIEKTSKKINTMQKKVNKDQQQQQQQSKKNEKSKNNSAMTMEKKSATVDRSEYRPKSHNDALNYSKERPNSIAYPQPDDDEAIYDESPKKRNDIGPQQQQQQQQTKQMQQQKSSKQNYDRKKSNPREKNLQDTNFYEDDIFVMKTVKRKEILKQYYSSGTDTELSSSDPYDCIVVEDHHLSNPAAATFRNRNSYAAAETSETRASAYQRSKTESLSGTLLPRTKLSKSIRSETNDFDFSDRINTTTRSNKISSKEKWTNLWSDE